MAKNTLKPNKTTKTLKPQKTASKKRVLMALSGGVDSAVSAWKLIQDGYEVEAAFMKNYSATKGLKFDECPWLADRQDALRVAAFLGIPMHTVNYEKEYEQNVLNYFFNEYKAGHTPNPDVMCNKEIKFKMLYNWAMDHGFDYVATGHYAQVVAKRVAKRVPVDNSNKVGKSKILKKTVGKSSISKKDAKLEVGLDSVEYTLQRSADDFKDQTYFIYNIHSPQLPHLIFPIGGMKKSAVKALAKKIGLPNADKKESMGLCFVGKIRLKEFLDQKLKPKPGPIVYLDDKNKQVKIGTHEGLAYYTIGQRQGVKVGAGGPWFVAKKDLKSNTLVVTNDPHDKLLETQEIEIHSVNWITRPASFPAKLQARFRHQGELQKIVVEKATHKRGSKDAYYKVTFSKPQLAIASGQSLVMYDGKICVGGGVIV